jgi:PKD repeat protein
VWTKTVDDIITKVKRGRATLDHLTESATQSLARSRMSKPGRWSLAGPHVPFDSGLMSPLTRHRTALPGRRSRRVRRRVTLLTSALALALGASLAPVGLASAATIPTAPSGLAAQVINGGLAITLAWADNSSDETAFEIERCTTTTAGCAFAPLATTAANQFLYLDNTTVGAYRYRVRAVNSTGASAWSVEAALPGGFGVPSGYPSAVMSATPTSGLAPLTVSFDGSQSTGIDFQPITTWSWSFGDGATASGPTASHVYTTPGTYRATLTVADARGVANLASTTITVSTVPPGTPTNLTASSTVRRRVDLQWTNPATTNATSLVVGRCTGSTCTVFSPVATLVPTESRWSDTNVRSGTKYRYIVTALNTQYGSTSNVVGVRAR